ncbi:unnamed protein product, partial [Hapterophycus canaliculatus]
NEEDLAFGHDGGVGGGQGGGPLFDLVIASDVIYSVSVVVPLFQTVGGLLLLSKPSSFSSSAKAPVDPCRGGGVVGLRAAASNPETSSRGDTDQEAVAERGGARGSGGGAPLGQGTEAAGSPRTSSQIFEGGRSSSGDGGGGRDGPGAPVFLMSQSFGYDAETERAIEQACVELGLVREVVWDELLVAPAGSQDEQKQQEQHGQRSSQPQQQARSPPPPLPPPKERLHPTLNGSSTSTSNSEDGGLLPLSQERRAGTKLQRFWRA